MLFSLLLLNFFLSMSSTQQLKRKKELLRKSEKELKKLCKTLHLDTTGNKREMIDRIILNDTISITANNDPNIDINKFEQIQRNSRKKHNKHLLNEYIGHDYIFSLDLITLIMIYLGNIIGVHFDILIIERGINYRTTPDWYLYGFKYIERYSHLSKSTSLRLQYIY